MSKTKNSGLEGFLKRASETTSSKEDVAESFMNAHDYIQRSYYVNHPNFDLGQCGQVNDTILMSLANSILRKNLLVKGNYGLGKTTTSEAVSSLIYQLPVEFVDKGMLQGNPFLTEEKIFGRVDLSKINRGEGEDVLFSLFSQTPSAKIVDEINRIPPQTQNSLLKAVETGQFGYLDRFVISPMGKAPFFATTNYDDIGNTEMSPPLLDRFDASVDVSQPLWLGNYIMGEPNLSGLRDDERRALMELRTATNRLIEASPDKADEILKESRKYAFEIAGTPDIKEQRTKISNYELSERLQEIFSDPPLSYQSKLEKCASIQREFNEQIRGIGVGNGKLKVLETIGKNQPFNENSQVYWNVFFDHINCIPKRPGDEMSNHDEQYPVGKIENELSVRPRIRGKEFAGLISYLKGEDSISTETVQQVLPYLISHRAAFSDNLEADASDDLTNSLSMRNAKHIIREFTEDVYGPNKEDFSRIYGSMNVPEQTASAYADHTEPSIREFAKRFRAREE